MLRRNLEQDLRRPGRGPPALLPVLQCVGADAQNGGELRLRQTKLASHPHNVGLWVDAKDARRIQLPFLNGFRLLHAFQQFFKQFFLHGINWPFNCLS